MPDARPCVRHLTRDHSTVEEARHFVEAVLGGRLPEYRCRLGRDGVHIVKPGTVFVYQHKGPSGIDRWVRVLWRRSLSGAN